MQKRNFKYAILMTLAVISGYDKAVTAGPDGATLQASTNGRV